MAMDKLITAFIPNISEALTIASNAKISTNSQEIRNIVVFGMGGSGIGAKIVSSWVAEELKVPMQIFQDYLCPAYVDQHTLVIGSSYSGNTEETMISLRAASEKGARIIGICSGGELQEFCAQKEYDCVVVPGGNPPRTALAFSIVQLTNIFSVLGLTSNKVLNDIKSSIVVLNANLDAIHQEAKEIATFIMNTVPIIYSVTRYEPIAVRARQQFNENSKILCWHHTLPEMNHNELVGWGGGDQRFSVLIFDTEDLYPRNQKRLDTTRTLIEEKTKVMSVKAKGNNFVEKSLYLIHLVDWASFYASELKQVDAIDIKVIDFLKSELANFQ